MEHRFSEFYNNDPMQEYRVDGHHAGEAAEIAPALLDHHERLLIASAARAQLHRRVSREPEQYILLKPDTDDSAEIIPLADELEPELVVDQCIVPSFGEWDVTGSITLPMQRCHRRIKGLIVPRKIVEPFRVRITVPSAMGQPG